jgi:hypothetical protein
MERLREEQNAELERRVMETELLMENRMLMEAAQSRMALEELRKQFEESERSLREQVGQVRRQEKPWWQIFLEVVVPTAIRSIV